MIRKAAVFITSPTVPRYEGGVQTQGVQAPRAQGLSPEAFGAGVGEGLSRIGKAGMAIVAEERQKEALTALNGEKVNALGALQKVVDGSADDSGNFKPGLGQLTGTDATDLEAKYRAEHDKIIRGVDLTKHPEAALRFQEWAEEQYNSNALRLNKHQYGQRQATAIATSEAVLKTVTDKSIRDFMNTGEFDETDAVKAVHDMASLTKAPPEQRARMLEESTSAIYRGIVQTGLQSEKPEDQARVVDFFDKTKGKMTLKDLGEVDNQVRSYKDAAVGKETAETIFAEGMKDITVNDAPPVGKMADDIDKNLGLSDTQKRLAKAHLTDRLQRYEQDKRRSQESTANAAHGAPTYADGVKVVTEASGGGGIDNEARDNILDSLDRKFRISETRNEAKAEVKAKQREAEAEAKRQRQLKQLGNLLQFQTEYMNGQHGTLDPKSIANSSGKFGAFTDNAMQFVANVNNDLGKAKVTGEQMNDTLRALRLNPQYKGFLPDPDDKEDRAKMALLQGKVMEYMSASQTVPGKGLPIDQAIIRATQAVTTEEAWGWFSSDTKEPLYLLGAQGGGSEAAKHPATWPKKTQDAYIDQQYALKNKGRSPSPELREKLRRALVEGK